MGLLDSVLGALGGQQAEGGVQNALVNGVLGLIEREGGLGGLVQNIKEKGFGEVVSSWVSTGENLPINSEQVQQALGSEEIQELAAKAGITAESAKTMLAQVLPDIIDKLTPEGSIPSGGLLEQGINLLKNKLGGTA